MSYSQISLVAALSSDGLMRRPSAIFVRQPRMWCGVGWRESEPAPKEARLVANENDL